MTKVFAEKLRFESIVYIHDYLYTYAVYVIGDHWLLEQLILVIQVNKKIRKFEV